MAFIHKMMPEGNGIIQIDLFRFCYHHSYSPANEAAITDYATTTTITTTAANSER